MIANAFQFDESKYYRFGMMVGFKNLLYGGLRLGPKKTAGKLLQPINSYTRFPEYWFIESEIERYLRTRQRKQRPTILDVGSPKCFGLYLAFHFDVDIHLTDIDDPSVQEAEILWNAIKSSAKGTVRFSVQDARSLKYPENAFDVVYSMSVIEHIEGETGDSQSVREMLRVLEPGGVLVVTVPIGCKYVEQERLGFRRAARNTGDQNRYFFQRIYTPLTAEERLVKVSSAARLTKAITVGRSNARIVALYRRFGTKLRAVCGCFNPLLSAAINHGQEGIVPVTGQYGPLYAKDDSYGDLMLSFRKNEGDSFLSA
jgi:SAM-dependent methyltransferase